MIHKSFVNPYRKRLSAILIVLIWGFQLIWHLQNRNGAMSRDSEIQELEEKLAKQEKKIASLQEQLSTAKEEKNKLKEEVFQSLNH